MKQVEKIRITPDMIVNDMGLERPQNFFCEVDSVGDPKAGGATAPTVHPRFDHWWIGETDLRFTVCLPGAHYIESVYIYNNYEGEHDVRIHAGTPFAWEHEKTVRPAERTWCGFELGFETEFIHFAFNNNEAPSEIVLYGYKTGEPAAIPPRGTHQMGKKLDKFFGINAFINDEMDVCSCANYIREYHPWLWTLDRTVDDALLAVEPANAGDNWLFETYYGKLYGLGVDVAPTLTWGNHTPKAKGMDPEDPAAYHKYASMLFQYVARYGRNKNIDPAKIHVAPGQEVKIGLGYMTAVEPLNEPDGTWLGREAYFTPFELAAFLSMCYDGHEGKYPDVGVKQADPSCLMSMSGGAGLSLTYLKAMDFWARYNRKDGKLPFDAFNAHRYCGKYVDASGLTQHVDVNIDERGDTAGKVYMGVSPEEGNIVGAFDVIREFRDTYYPDMEIWLTEFGWDTNQSFKTATSAHAYGDYTGRQVQGMWLIREYLLLSSIGVERAAMYMSRDCGPEETSVGKYGTSGIVCAPHERKGYVVQGNKKDSYYYIYTVKELLKDTHFAEAMEADYDNMNVFRYENDEGKSVYAVWCTTMDNRKVPGVAVPVASETATLVELENLTIRGKRTALTAENGYVYVDVSEKPVFIVEN